MERTDLNEGFTCLDAESMRSFSESLPDEYHEWVSESGRSSRLVKIEQVETKIIENLRPNKTRNEQLLDDFPRPPSRPGNLNGVNGKNLDAIVEEEIYPTPKTSIKNLRRHVTASELVVTAANDYPLLQELNPHDGAEEFNPINEEGACYDLIAPWGGVDAPLHKLERLTDVMFGEEHMLSILNNPRYLARFREFLIEERPRSISTLTYYLNAAKALKAIEYANALVRLSTDIPPPSVRIVQESNDAVGITVNKVLEQRVADALRALTAEELPAFITSRCITITSKIVEERVRGTLPLKFRETSNALAEVFCLTDPSRPDNPIIFASEGMFPIFLFASITRSF
jgi:hypothetical protein